MKKRVLAKFAFVNLKYRPKKKDLICLFKVSPAKGLSIKKAANTVALESSVGTWTPVSSSKRYVNKLAAKVFSINGKNVKIAYPIRLFEEDNAPNILSSIAGNIFGMKAIENLRLEDIDFPDKIIESFPGPRYGIKGIRKILKVRKRPLVGTIVKPKLGLKTKDHVNVAREAWVGGCDLVKDDENLASQSFNQFDKRAAKTLEMADLAEAETGEKKGYLINVTAETGEMLKRADVVKELGGKFVMHDIITSGFASLQTLRENTKLVIHAHRAMHGAFTENPLHGISMMVIADFSRMIGVDSLHIGTGIGKMKGKVEEVENIREEIELPKVKETKFRLAENWVNKKPVMAVCSGGIYPGHIPYLIEHFGKDIIIQAGGGIHGHPDGTRVGARAMRQGVDAVMKKKTLKQWVAERDASELGAALKFWGKIRF
ncbi:type III ribulose-bisphosphate carboxylase [archaeon]|nr:type III ribulose-bisphosphate carboxylase [archaeon]|tara:strand:- start:700 stop:1989 length:1290 start_codon:yes stop_codon:yes gene_type:complete